MFPQVRSHVVEVARQRPRPRMNAAANSSGGACRPGKRVSSRTLDQGLMNAGNVLVLDLERSVMPHVRRMHQGLRADSARRRHAALIREGRCGFDKCYLVAEARAGHASIPTALSAAPTAAIERTEAGDINIQETPGHRLAANVPKNCPYGNINMVGFDTKETTAVGKGDRSNLCAAPSGPFRQIGPVPFSRRRQIAVRRQKATTCDKCVGIGQPSCVYACPHDAAHRMEGKELLELVRQRNLKG